MCSHADLRVCVCAKNNNNIGCKFTDIPKYQNERKQHKMIEERGECARTSARVRGMKKIDYACISTNGISRNWYIKCQNIKGFKISSWHKIAENILENGISCNTRWFHIELEKNICIMLVFQLVERIVRASHTCMHTHIHTEHKTKNRRDIMYITVWAIPLNWFFFTSFWNVIYSSSSERWTTHILYIHLTH